MDFLKVARVASLSRAQSKAEALFSEVEARGLVRSGISEAELSQSIYELAFEMFGTKRHWHKRVVRAGRNTLAPYKENPPNIVIAEGDVVFLDLGPVFEEWEADFGRTFVLGSDPLKLKLLRDIQKAFAQGKAYFREHSDITGSELYAYVRSLATQAGWEYGGPHAGHLIGEFPHERIEGDKVTLYIHPENHMRMRELDKNGQERHWILEIHFIDRLHEFGGFYEELLTI